MILRKIKGVHINGRRSLSLDGGMAAYLNPEYVYIPLTNGNANYKCLVEVGTKVMKGQAVALREDRFGHPLHAPVSGEVTALKKVWHVNGKVLESIEIKNDKQEKWHTDYGKHVGDFNKETWVQRIKECGLVGLGGAGFPTWAKYSTTAEINVVIVNAAECEPYLTSDHVQLQNEPEKFLRGVKYAMQLSGAKRAVIAIKKYKKELIEKYNNLLKGDESIQVFLLNDVYPAGWERYIVERVVGRRYDFLPSEVGALVNNVQTFIALTEALEENKPVIERVVTISGEGLAAPKNVVVKIGTRICDILDNFGSTNGNYVKDSSATNYLIAGGPMTGRALYSDETYILPQTGSILLLPKNNNILAQACLGCGKCAEKCPVFLTPTEIRSALDEKNNIALEKLNTLKCVQCGLCSYVCPSRIEMTNFVAKAMDLVRKNRSNQSKKG